MNAPVLNFDEKTLRALVALRTNDDFKTVMEALVFELDRATQSLIFNADESRVAVERGYARALLTFLQTVEHADALLERQQK